MQQGSRREAVYGTQNLAAGQLFSSALPAGRRLRNLVNGKCASIVKTMLERCKKEQSFNCLHVPINDYVQRVSFYTGLPSTYLAHLATEKFDSKKEPPMVVDLIVILKCLKEEYSSNKYPTTKEVFDAVLLFRQENNMRAIDYEQFCHQMVSLQFCERPTKTGKYLLMEDPKITFERYNYLKRLEKLRNKVIHIYYLDERIIGNSLSSNGCELVNVMLFFAVLRNNGYVRGLYCTNPDKDDYMKWITDIILPLLIPSSLIIMSHGQFLETAATNMTRYHSKAEMIKCLMTNNVACSDKMHKAELYELISKSNLQCEQSDIECILKAHGHEVLFRPSSYNNCTPTESFWNDLKSEVSLTVKNDYDPKLQDKIQTFIDSLTQLQWVGYEESVVKQEKLLLTIDQQIQEALDNYEFDPVACENVSFEDDYNFVVNSE